MRLFEFVKTIKGSAVLSCRHIIGYIYIPPGVVIIDAIPSVMFYGFVRDAIDYITGDVLATAEGGEEIGEVVADTFMGA